MDSTQFLFFDIEIDHLKTFVDKTLPITLFGKPQGEHVYSILISANTPMDSHVIERIKDHVSQGGALSVKTTQKNTFLREAGLKEEDIPSLRALHIHPLVEKRMFYLNKLEELKKVQERDNINPFTVYKEEIQRAFLNNNFEALNEIVSNEVLSFDVGLNETLTFAIILTNDLFPKDTTTNRIVSLSYLTAKLKGINEEAELGELLFASFIHHVGLTRLRRYYNFTASKDLEESDLSSYRKHVQQTLHLLSKKKITPNERSLRIIEDHHEHLDGSGFPKQKVAPHIDPLASILGMCSDIITNLNNEFDDEEKDIEGFEILSLIQLRAEQKNYRVIFGEDVYDIFSKCTNINTD